MTKQRAFIEKELLPKFANMFKTNEKVVNMGAGYHPYKEFFTCDYKTSDINGSSDETYPVEHIPYPDETLDGIVCIGVTERMNDPIKGLQEMKRVLKKGGRILIGFPYKFVWASPKDFWRYTPVGAKKVMEGYTILTYHNVDDVYLLFIAQK